jgi:hypothetical protein
VVNHGDIAYLCSAVFGSNHNFLTMTPPSPDLHTYFDDELGERLFWSADPIAYDHCEMLVVVPPKFLSDGFSIPKFFRGFFGKAPSYIGAAILHDWLYKKRPNKKITRKAADKLFLYWMKAYGVGSMRRRLIYWAVRTGARKSWRVKTPQFATDNHHD